MAFETGALHASAIQNAGGLTRFDLDVVGFGSPALTAARIQFHIRRNQDRVDLAASADNLHLSPSLRGTFGDDIKLIALHGGVIPASALDGLCAGRADWRDTVEALRKASGTLRAEPFEISWGKLDMTGQGALALDDLRRPKGLLDFKIMGVGDWLAHDVAIKPGTIASALRDRAAKAGSDEAGRMGAVLGARNGIAYLGDEPVGEVSPLY